MEVDSLSFDQTIPLTDTPHPPPPPPLLPSLSVNRNLLKRSDQSSNDQAKTSKFHKSTLSMETTVGESDETRVRASSIHKILDLKREEWNMGCVLGFLGLPSGHCMLNFDFSFLVCTSCNVLLRIS